MICLLSLRGVGNMSGNKYNYNFYTITKYSSMTSNRNHFLPEKSSVEDRVFMLSQKINSFKLAKPEESLRKCNRIEAFCDQVQSDYDEFNQYFTSKMFDLKHTLSKISKELQMDHSKTDALVRQQIDLTHKKIGCLVEEQSEKRRATDEKMLKFIDQQTAILRQMIENEARQRQSVGLGIEQSLEADICEIKGKIEETQDFFHERMAKIDANFRTRFEKLQEQLKQTCDSSSQNQSDFYRMLRDLVKKVKNQLAEHQAKRQATEEQILALIEKMCDNAIDNRVP